MRKVLMALGLVLGLASASHATVRGYWPGNLGSQAVDFSGMGNNLIVTGTVPNPGTPQPPNGNGWLFQGPLSAVNSMSVPLVAFQSGNTSALSIYFWLSSTATALDPVWSFSSSVSNTYMSIDVSSTGKLVVFYTNENGAATTATSATVNDGTNHLIWLRVGTVVGLQIYVDGNLSTYDSNPPQFGVPATVVMGQDLFNGIYADNKLLVDAFQLGDSYTDAYLGPQTAQTPTNTPTVTPTPTYTNTPTPTYTNTTVASPTFTPTISATSTYTRTPSQTVTSTSTYTATSTLTATATRTSTLTATVTPTPSATRTPSLQPTTRPVFASLGGWNMTANQNESVHALDGAGNTLAGIDVMSHYFSPPLEFTANILGTGAWTSVTAMAGYPLCQHQPCNVAVLVPATAATTWTFQPGLPAATPVVVNGMYQSIPGTPSMANIPLTLGQTLWYNSGAPVSISGSVSAYGQ